MAVSNTIRALLSGEIVAGSRLGDKLLEELLADGMLSVVVRGSKKSYRARDVKTLRQYLIDKDERYRILEVSAYDIRAAMATDTGNSKLITVRSCPGFPVNTWERLVCRLHNSDMVVNPTEGSFVFITDWKHFVIPHDVVVVGVENMENFRLIGRQKAFIEKYLKEHGYPNHVLFVSRYPQSTDLRRWLITIPNRYLHFGDFDLAGIHIFLSEFQRYLGSERAAFLIPDDITDRLRYGSSQRYNDQYVRFRGISSDCPDLQQLIDFIHQVRKGYDQEGYITPRRVGDRL